MKKIFTIVGFVIVSILDLFINISPFLIAHFTGNDWINYFGIITIPAMIFEIFIIVKWLKYRNFFKN